MTKSLLPDAFAHHVWATITLIDACLALSEEQLATNVPGTYGSIVDTMRHTVAADASYLALLTGGAVPEVDDEKSDLAELRAAMERHRPVWASLVAGTLDPDETVTRYRDDGSQSHAPLGIRVAQALQHGNDHRSQICTAITTLGVEPPEIDVWAFAKEDGRLSEAPAPS